MILLGNITTILFLNNPLKPFESSNRTVSTCEEERFFEMSLELFDLSRSKDLPSNIPLSNWPEKGDKPSSFSRRKTKANKTEQYRLPFEIIIPTRRHTKATLS